MVEHLITEAAEAYHEGTDEGIQKLLEEWEEEIKQGNEIEEDMENWRTLVLDPGNPRGRITKFKQTLYLYWLMKNLLGKAMEQISVGMAVSLQGMPSYKQDL